MSIFETIVCWYITIGIVFSIALPICFKGHKQDPERNKLTACAFRTAIVITLWPLLLLALFMMGGRG